MTQSANRHKFVLVVRRGVVGRRNIGHLGAVAQAELSPAEPAPPLSSWEAPTHDGATVLPSSGELITTVSSYRCVGGRQLVELRVVAQPSPLVRRRQPTYNFV